jgi:predicted type IV restriction endonuclease
MADTAVETDSTKPMRTGPKWEADAQDRLRKAIRKFARPLADLVARDANEGDTRLLVTDFLCEGLGFDKFEHLTTEYAVKGDFADYGIRIDKQLVAFIEVKRTTTKLSKRHLRQVEMYAVNEGVEWMILTNGGHWQAYHLSPGMPVEIDLALDVNLLTDGTVPHKAQTLFYLSLESLKRRQIDDLWKAKRATSPKSIARVLGSEQVLEAVRRELRRATGHNVDTDELGRLMKETVIRPECF